jgi:hypothetical protein
MTTETAQEIREQMLRDGFCVIPGILDQEFVQELRGETDRLNNTVEHHPDARYQGTHVGVKYEENEYMRQLSEWPPARQALGKIGFGDFKRTDGLIILTKEPYGPALYWHQDWSRWNDPLSCSPWPQQIFLSYYLEETQIENGCLKVIPGTHLERIPLHDNMVTAHEQGARFIEDDHPVMFSDHPDQVNVFSKPGDLVLADARVLHSACKNQTGESRNLILLWHNRPETVPEYWESEVPSVIKDRAPEASYERTRIPGEYLVSKN